jgi:predicted dehydrogenase
MKLRWGVLGTSGIAREQVIPAIQQSSNGKAFAVAGRDAARTKAYADALGIVRAHDSYEALLGDPDVDAVYIPMPNSHHAEWSVRAAKAGKPVLCEKPLATSADDARRVVEICAERNVPLMEAFMYRFHPQNERVLELIGQGAIGEVREVRSHLSVDIMSPPDYGNIRFDVTTGGGTLLDMGCYVVDIARRIVGEEPRTVQGWWSLDARSAVDVSTAGILGFSDGRVATITCSFKANGNGAYTVVGTRGTIEVPRAIIPGMAPRAAEGMVIVVDQNGYRREEIFAPVNQYGLMAESFAHSVLTGAPTRFAPGDSILNMTVLDALAESARTGGAIALEHA